MPLFLFLSCNSQSKKNSVDACIQDISAEDLNAAEEKDYYKAICMPMKCDWCRLKL